MYYKFTSNDNTAVVLYTLAPLCQPLKFHYMTLKKTFSPKNYFPSILHYNEKKKEIKNSIHMLFRNMILPIFNIFVLH